MSTLNDKPAPAGDDAVGGIVERLEKRLKVSAVRIDQGGKTVCRLFIFPEEEITDALDALQRLAAEVEFWKGQRDAHFDVAQTLRKHIAQLETALAAARADADRLRGVLGELVVIAREKYLLSNPPKHIVVYRMYEIAKRALAEGEA